jgi:hypothetical protein
MLHVLHEIEARHFGFGLLLLIFLVFIATPILKHLLFRRARGGSVWLPPRRPPSAQEVRQARRYLAERRRNKAGPDADGG